jgi:glycosyltransferase involved in cell wall biosynthesis
VNELAQIYSAADIFINPSVEETLGLTTAEALACGTSVITYNKTAVPEVPDESCGIVCSCNVEDIVKALPQAVFSEKACRERAKFFDKQLRYQEYLDLYKAIIARRS